MANIITNDGSKALFLDFSYLQNVLFKNNSSQLDVIVEKLGIEGVNYFQEFQTILRNSMVKNAFICLIDDKTRTIASKNLDSEVFDAIIRLELNSDAQRKLPKNTFLGFFVNINPRSPQLTITSIFQTRLKPIAQDFETIIAECNLQIITYKGQVPAEEILRRGIINSSTITSINKLQSNFEAEKLRWLNYLDFTTELLNLQRKNSLPYLGSQTLRLVKVERKDLTPQLVDKEQDFSRKLAHAYFKESEEIIVKNANVAYELVDVIVLDVLSDNNEKITRIKRMQDLSLVPFSTNKAFPAIYNLQKNPAEIFSFNFEKSKETKNTVSLSGFLAIDKNKQTLGEYWSKNQEIIFGTKKEFNYAQKEFVNELKNWTITKILYEVNGEIDSSAFLGRNDVNKLSAGYLAFVGVGEDVLIERSRQVLKRISEGNIKNPYLVNYLFNTKLVQLAEGNDDFRINDDQFYFSLNSEQKDAVIKALNSKDLFMLQGPPGTGKTQVICELIYQLSKMDRKILISSQNHEAISNVIERLPFEPNVNRVRLVNQINIKNKEKNNFSPERVVYNYYKAIAKSVFDDMQVEQSTIVEFNEVEKKLEALLNANKGYHQNTNQVRAIQSQIEKHKEEISAMKNQELTLITKRNDLNDEIFNIDNFIADLEAHEFNSAISISDSIIKAYEKNIRFMMDEFTLNNLGITLDPENIYLELKKVCQNVLNNDEVYLAIKKTKESILMHKHNAEFDLIANEEATLAGYELLLSKNQKINEFLDLLAQFKKVLEELKTDLKYNFEKNSITNFDPVRINLLEVEINRLYVQRQNLESNVGTTGQELRELIKFINQKFDLELDVTDIDLDAKLKKQLDEYRAKLELSMQKKQEYEGLYRNVMNYVQTNYGISNNWTEELPTNKFTAQMIQESKKYTNNILNKLVNIYGMTLTSSNLFKYSNDNFAKKMGLEEISLKTMDVDVVIIDEASKATLIEILMPLIYGKTLILVGDYRQLPPILKLQQSDVDQVNEATNKEYSYSEMFELLDKSIFKNLIGANNRSLTTMLKTQYRSHQQIMDVVNMFYDGELRVDAEVSERKRHDLNVFSKHGQEIINAKSSVYWIDSTFDQNNQPCFEKSLETSTSLYNDLEINLTIETMKRIDEALAQKELKIKPSLAVISFYGLHVAKIKRELKKTKFKNFNLIVSTVDDFQGKEADYVIVNMVRNPHQISLKQGRDFLRKYERINVAYSRARELLVIIGAVRAVKDITVKIPTVTDLNISNSREVYADIIAKIEFNNGLLKANDLL